MVPENVHAAVHKLFKISRDLETADDYQLGQIALSQRVAWKAAQMWLNDSPSLDCLESRIAELNALLGRLELGFIFRYGL